jgi:cobalt transporter subunit CbtA
MYTRVFAVGLLAGLLAGLIVALLQAYTTTPIIIEAERFENASPVSPSASFNRFGEARLILVHSGHDESVNAAEASEWAPAEGLERTVFTSIATIGTAVGFAMILLAGMLAAGDKITEQSAMVWGASGFVAAGLAPAVGLAPEVPGLVAADIIQRQQWWIMTAAMTAVAIWLFLRGQNPWLRLLAIPVVLAPHVWGAPHVALDAATRVPAELAARFAAVSLAVQAILWIATAFFVGLFWQRMGASADGPDGR